MVDIAALCGLGCMGAIAIEVLRLRKKYGDVSKEQFHDIISGRAYWVLEVATVVVSGGLTAAYFNGAMPEEWIEPVAVGIAVRTVAIETLGAWASNGRLQAGSVRGTFRDIL